MFIFAKIQKKEIPVIEEIKKNIPNFLNGLQWRKKCGGVILIFLGADL